MQWVLMGFNAVTWDLTFTNRDQPWDLNGDVIPKTEVSCQFHGLFCNGSIGVIVG